MENLDGILISENSIELKDLNLNLHEPSPRAKEKGIERIFFGVLSIAKGDQDKSSIVSYKDIGGGFTIKESLFLNIIEPIISNENVKRCVTNNLKNYYNDPAKIVIF